MRPAPHPGGNRPPEPWVSRQSRAILAWQDDLLLVGLRRAYQWRGHALQQTQLPLRARRWGIRLHIACYWGVRWGMFLAICYGLTILLAGTSLVGAGMRASILIGGVVFAGWNLRRRMNRALAPTIQAGVVADEEPTPERGPDDLTIADLAPPLHRKRRRKRVVRAAPVVHRVAEEAMLARVSAELGDEDD